VILIIENRIPYLKDSLRLNSPEKCGVYVDRAASRKRVIEGTFVEEPRMSGAKEVDADGTDDAEIEAILFAIEQFTGKYDLVKIVCDHFSQ
jgi:hypothetical protein